MFNACNQKIERAKQVRAKSLNSQALFCVDDYVKLGADHTMCSVIYALRRAERSDGDGRG